MFPRALKAVALLGAGIPGVAGLKPLREAFNGAVGDIHVYKLTPEEIMGKDDDKVAAELTAAQTKIAELTAQVAKLQTGGDADAIKTLQTQLAAAVTAQADADKRFAALAETRRLDRVNAKVKELRVPAYRPFVAALYALATTSEKTVKFGETGKESDQTYEAICDQLVAKINKDTEYLFRELGRTTPILRDDAPADDNPGVEVDKRTRAHMAEKGEKDYSKAMAHVLAADTELKKLYAASTAPKGD